VGLNNNLSGNNPQNNYCKCNSYNKGKSSEEGGTSINGGTMQKSNET
jgi:hypothetical protein